MSRYVLIRDDDACFFTNPELLEQVFEPLFSRGLPVNFSVVPSIASHAPLGYAELGPFSRFGLRHEPFIPPSWRGREAILDVGENPALIEFLKSVPCEILQHGLSHLWDGGPEFGRDGDAKDIVQQRIQTGRGILERAFGRRPGFFCPPYDALSRVALSCLKEEGFQGVSMSHLGRNLPPRLWHNVAWGRMTGNPDCLWWGEFLVLGHRGYVLNMFEPPGRPAERFRALLNEYPMVVLVTHHWEFAFDFLPKPLDERLKELRSIVEVIESEPDVEVVTFSQFYERAGNGHGSASASLN
jgi:hypothetical protein